MIVWNRQGNRGKKKECDRIIFRGFSYTRIWQIQKNKKEEMMNSSLLVKQFITFLSFSFSLDSRAHSLIKMRMRTTKGNHTFLDPSWRKDVLVLPLPWASRWDHSVRGLAGDQSNHQQSDRHAALQGSAWNISKEKHYRITSLKLQKIMIIVNKRSGRWK